MKEQNDILTVEHLKKNYGKLKAVNDISFSVKKGEIFGILGPNGAGKNHHSRNARNLNTNRSR